MEYVCLVLVFIGLFMFVLFTHLVQQNTLKLKQTYADSLDLLRSDPTNPTYHEQALQAGRQYAATTRNNKSVTLFDETALANDIRAVTANASQFSSIRQQKATTQQNQDASKSNDQWFAERIAVKEQQATTQQNPNPSQSDNQSIAERIAALKTLKEAEMISDEEYESKRKAIIDSI